MNPSVAMLSQTEAHTDVSNSKPSPHGSFWSSAPRFSITNPTMRHLGPTIHTHFLHYSIPVYMYSRIRIVNP